MDIKNKKDVLAELHFLKEIIHGIGLPAEVMEEGDQFPVTTLVVAVPKDEEEEKEGSEEAGEDASENQFITINFMPVTEEEAEYSMFLQMYTDVDIPENEWKDEVFYRAANRMNQILPVGGCFYVPADEDEGIPSKFGLRHVFTANKENHIEDVTFCETLFFLIYSYEYMEMAAKEMAEGKKPEDIMQF